MKKGCGCIPESKETPEYEAKSHPKGFLKKAARLAEHKLGHKKEKKGKKHSSRKAKRY